MIYLMVKSPDEAFINFRLEKLIHFLNVFRHIFNLQVRRAYQRMGCVTYFCNVPFITYDAATFLENQDREIGDLNIYI